MLLGPGRKLLHGLWRRPHVRTSGNALQILQRAFGTCTNTPAARSNTPKTLNSGKTLSIRPRTLQNAWQTLLRVSEMPGRLQRRQSHQERLETLHSACQTLSTFPTTLQNAQQMLQNAEQMPWNAPGTFINAEKHCKMQCWGTVGGEGGAETLADYRPVVCSAALLSKPTIHRRDPYVTLLSLQTPQGWPKRCASTPGAFLNGSKRLWTVWERC